MSDKIIIAIYDRDGTPSSGYPVKVALSKNQDTLSIVGTVTDAITGYASGQVTVYTDDSGRAPILVDSLSASNVAQTGDFATMVAAGEVGTLDYQLPLSSEVALTDSTNQIITPSIIPGEETYGVSEVADGFSIFQLYDGEYPYPRTISCVTDDGRLMRYIDIHPERRPGVDFAATQMPVNSFVYSLNENAIYIPDVTITSIVTTYVIRPFYVSPTDLYTLKIYNRKSQVNVAPNKTLGQRLNAAVLNGGLIEEESFNPVTITDDQILASVFRDIQGNDISGTVNFYPDIILYLWAEYPNVMGETAPVRRVKEILMPNPLHQVQQAVNFVRG